MQSADFETWIIQWLADRLCIDAIGIDPAAPFVRLGFDSMMLVAFLVDLEKQVGHPVDVDIIEAHPSPAKLAEHLKMLG